MTTTPQAPARIDVMRPWLGPEEVAALREVVESGWVAQGPKVAEFEERFAARMGVAHAVATSSCTAALHLALVLRGIGAGDEVVVPSFSFIATANAVRYVGARAVFADIDPETGNITAQTVGQVLSGSTRAVIGVDQGGVPLDLHPLRELLDPRGIALIEDAACGTGSTYRGSPVGADADIACWSFHPRKLLTTGEGGMLTTNDAPTAQRARRLREHAMDISAATRHRTLLAPAEHYLEVGFNYRMTDLQAAVGIVQIGRLDAIVARRRSTAERYQSRLHGIAGIRPITDPDWGTTNYQSCWIELDDRYPVRRDDLLRILATEGISGRRGIMTAHRQPAYAGVPHADLSASERLSDNSLILPVHHELTDAEIDRVADLIIQTAGEGR